MFYPTCARVLFFFFISWISSGNKCAASKAGLIFSKCTRGHRKHIASNARPVNPVILPVRDTPRCNPDIVPFKYRTRRELEHLLPLSLAILPRANVDMTTTRLLLGAVVADERIPCHRRDSSRPDDKIPISAVSSVRDRRLRIAGKLIRRENRPHARTFDRSLCPRSPTTLGRRRRRRLVVARDAESPKSRWRSCNADERAVV